MKHRLLFLLFCFVILAGVLMTQAVIFAAEKGAVQPKADSGFSYLPWRTTQKAEGKPAAWDASRDTKKDGKDASRAKGNPNPPNSASTRRSPGPGNQMAELREKHPRLFELIQEDVDLEKKAAELAKQWKAAEAGKKDEVKAELKKVLDQHFQVREERRLYELKMVEDRLREMRIEIEERPKKKDRIVEKRMKDLLEKEEAGLEF